MAKLPPKTYTYNLTPRQKEAWLRLMSPESCAVLYGGAKGGGKSWLACVWVMAELDALIKFFELKKSANPPVVGFFGRKRAVDFNKTTLETWKRTIPPEIYTIREQQKEIVFRGCVKLWFGGLDDQEQVNKFNSAELALIVLDQAEEAERAEVDVLNASLRFKIGDKVPAYKTLYTANPAECFLKTDFIDEPKAAHYYIPALPSDNPHLPGDYCQRLTDIFKHSAGLTQAYLFGNWHALAADNAVFNSVAIQALHGIEFRLWEFKRGVICDPSLGGDECVINVMEDGKILLQKILIGERDTMKIAGEMLTLARQFNNNNFALDTIGIGQGIADRLNEMNAGYILRINSAESAKQPERFANLRAEMWWYAMEQVLDKKIPYVEDEETRRQLLAVRFKVINSNGCIQLEPKADTKKRLGRSPDRADAWIYGVWAKQFFKSSNNTLSNAQVVNGRPMIPPQQRERVRSLLR